MIGDAAARGKRSSTKEHGPEYKKKNSEGRSYKHVADSKGENDKNSGGDKLTHSTAKKMHKAMKSFSPGVADRQAPHKQKERKEVRHVDQGQILDEWCKGKRGSYK
jgi:hypothetical protein